MAIAKQHAEEFAHQLLIGELAFKAVRVKKHHPGVKALDGVDLQGYAGSVLAVCGANGAGKSTFAKLLAGVETLTDGEITITGYPHYLSRPRVGVGHKVPPALPSNAVTNPRESIQANLRRGCER